MRFDKKVALVTAAASGIGRATADIIAAEGGTVVAVDTDKARLDKTLAEIHGAGGRAFGRQADALDWDEVLATNLGGAFYCIQAALKPMLKQRAGRIVSITSGRNART